MSRRPRKCWSDCKEVQHTCLNSHQHYTVHGHSLHFTAGPLYCFVNTCRFRHLYIEINQLICLWIIIALVYAVIAVACHLCVTCVVERAKTWDDIVRSLCISASSLVPFWLMCHCVLSGHFAMQHSVHKHFLYKKYKYWYYWALIHSLLCHCWFGAVSGILLSYTEKKSTLSALPFWFGISWAKWSTYPRNEVTETFSRKFLWVTGLHGKWPWNCWYLQNVKNIFILCQ